MTKYYLKEMISLKKEKYIKNAFQKATESLIKKKKKQNLQRKKQVHNYTPKTKSN